MIKMLIKIKEEEKICMHPEHEPPRYMVLESGTYKHVCPNCGKEKIFTVSNPYGDTNLVKYKVG